MCHLGVIQLNLVFMICSILCDPDELSLNIRMPKTFDEEKECVINSVPMYAFYKHKWVLQIFWEWQNQRALKFCTSEPDGLFEVKILVWSQVRP